MRSESAPRAQPRAFRERSESLAEGAAESAAEALPLAKHMGLRNSKFFASWRQGLCYPNNSLETVDFQENLPWGTG